MTTARSTPATRGRSGRPTARGSALRRAAVRRRRRRRRIGFGLLAGGALVAVFVTPLFSTAVKVLTLPLKHADIIRQQAAAKHLDPALIAAVIYAETKFEPRTSPTGALGLMQIEPQTALDLARRSHATTFTPADLATPQVNIAYGTFYLRELLDHYRGDTLEAVAAYNGGEANVDGWTRHARADGHELTVADIPFPETQAYVAKVLQAERDYRASYAADLGYG